MILDIDIKYAGVLPNKKIYQKPKQIFKKKIVFFYMYIPVNITEVPYLAHVVKTQVIFMETFLSFRTHLLLCFSFWRWLIEMMKIWCSQASSQLGRPVLSKQGNTIYHQHSLQSGA